MDNIVKTEGNGRISRANIWRSLVLSCTILLSLDSVAAEIPHGVVLASRQEVVINNEVEPESLDPHKVSGSPEFNILGNLFEGLGSFDPYGKVVPGMALHWGSTPDFKLWTIYLRPEARWSNGAPLTAHDFVYSWRRLADPKTASPYAYYLLAMRLKNIDTITTGEVPSEKLGISAIDDHTLQLSLSSPVPHLDKMLANACLYPLHRETLEKFGDRWTDPENYVGNGAYKIEKWRVNEQITLLRNKNYWDDVHTVINKVTFLPLSSEGSDVKRYQAGEIDVTGRNLSTDQFKKFKRTVAAEVRVLPRVALYFYELNMRQAPFDDPRVRRALSLSLDREGITMTLNQGQSPAYSFSPSYLDDFKPTPAAWASLEPQQRQEEARKLLQEAGYGKEKPLKFTLTYDNKEYHKKIAIAAASMWKKALGAEVCLEAQEWKSFLANRAAGKLQAAAITWYSDYNGPSAFLDILLSNSSISASGYSSKNFDDLMIRTLSTPTSDERNQIYQKAEDQLMLDLPIIPIFHAVEVRLVKPHVGGFASENPMGQFYVKDLYCKSRSSRISPA